MPGPAARRPPALLSSHTSRRCHRLLSTEGTTSSDLKGSGRGRLGRVTDTSRIGMGNVVYPTDVILMWPPHLAPHCLLGPTTSQVTAVCPTHCLLHHHCTTHTAATLRAATLASQSLLHTLDAYWDEARPLRGRAGRCGCVSGMARRGDTSGSGAAFGCTTNTTSLPACQPSLAPASSTATHTRASATNINQHIFIKQHVRSTTKINTLNAQLIGKT